MPYDPYSVCNRYVERRDICRSAVYARQRMIERGLDPDAWWRRLFADLFLWAMMLLFVGFVAMVVYAFVNAP